MHLECIVTIIQKRYKFRFVKCNFEKALYYRQIRCYKIVDNNKEKK